MEGVFEQFSGTKRSKRYKLISFKRKRSTSIFKGVMFVKSQKKWRAQVCLGGRKKYIGSYDSEFDAAIARDDVIKQLFGYRKDMLNFPDIIYKLPYNVSQQSILPSCEDEDFLDLIGLPEWYYQL